MENKHTDTKMVEFVFGLYSHSTREVFLKTLFNAHDWPVATQYDGHPNDATFLLFERLKIFYTTLKHLDGEKPQKMTKNC